MKMSDFETVDGNHAAADTAYDFTEIAAIYPITPSSPMANLTDQWAAKGRKNMFDQPVRLIEMQSEAGAIGAVHGSLQTGALTTTYTSSQGLMLMIPTLYRIAGERLPAVLHVASRTVGTHAMSIFGDHSDVMACRQTGLALLSSGSVQEAADLAAVAHLAAVKGRIPFMHFFDGFRTSHEITRIRRPDVKKLTALMDKTALDEFRAHALNPEHPRLRNTVQNGDVYFQIREANNAFYDALPDIVDDYMEKVGEVTGRRYHLFDYYGDPEATDVVIAMGSVSGTIRETVDYLNENASDGKKYGFVQVHLYRPFKTEAFLSAVPKTAMRIAVLDRCKEMGSIGEPLFLDVTAAMTGAGRHLDIIGGRYGLSSKDTDPAQIMAVFENLSAKNPIRGFTVGIEDDVTHKSLSIPDMPGFKDSSISCKFWGLGGDGTVGANHNTIEILGDHGDMYTQAYFEYDAKKSFGITKSHLRMSKKPIEGSYYVKHADFLACHHQNFLLQYDIVEEVKDEGTLLLNTSWDLEKLEKKLTGHVKKLLSKKRIKLFTIDATEIAKRLGLGSHTNTVLQAAFFKVSGLMETDKALDLMKEAAKKTYFTKGDEVVAKNVAAIDEGAKGVNEIKVPSEWADSVDTDLEDRRKNEAHLPDAVKNILYPINRQHGDDLPVSAFKGYEDGTIELGLTAYEKRAIAVSVPEWNADACIQCNRCSFVCPHAAIRPFLLSEQEKEKAPEGFKTAPLKGKQAEGKNLSFSMQISSYDCTSCGSCVNDCPVPDGKALHMVPAHFGQKEKDTWDYALSLTDKKEIFDRWTVKGSQFKQPLVEFSAACAGCGETPYAKLMTQLFGDRVYWANGTGCSQAWGAPMPGIPYTVNKRGFGPAWTNSLFENNAELALGTFLSVTQQRKAEKTRVEDLLDNRSVSDRLREAGEEWLSSNDDFERSRAASDALIEALEHEKNSPLKKEIDEILKYKDMLAKKTFWMYGGDGWAYDIGFGGLDHVISLGLNLNILIIDTEVYSNTGGQSSKATPVGAVAQFASAGKKTRKKDIGAMLMSYGNVYVASVAMGADMNQLVTAIKEAETYDGTSVIVAYAPCSAHGIRTGMGTTQAEMKKAVDAGYWFLYRYDPRKEHPMTLDSKEPTMEYEEFLDGETRYAALRRTFPDNAVDLFKVGSEDSRARYEKYLKMSKE